MSKKRVHEIAKELKQHGIEVENKELKTAKPPVAAKGFVVKRAMVDRAEQKRRDA